jgi:hypothetical protein
MELPVPPRKTGVALGAALIVSSALAEPPRSSSLSRSEYVPDKRYTASPGFTWESALATVR